MRIWSIAPSQLDRAALVACWRETLLAQKVLQGRTRGYTNHPQLIRFKAMSDPVAAIGSYLDGLAAEATLRGYHFNATKIIRKLDIASAVIPVTNGQLQYEWQHLLRKTEARDTSWHASIVSKTPQVHPLFKLVDGPVADWEKVQNAQETR